MRSEFLAMVDIREQAEQARRWGNQAGEEYNRVRADTVDAEWQRSDRAEDWRYLAEVYITWSQSPKEMSDPEQAGELTEMQRRSQFQARDMTGNGLWPWSPLAASAERRPVPGHAFAGLVNGRSREREEMER